VPQRLEAVARRAPGGPLGVIGELLGRRDGHGRGRGGQPPRCRAVPLPRGPQGTAETRRAQGRALLLALALRDAAQQPSPLESGVLEADDRTDPPPGGRGRHEERPVFAVARTGAQAVQCLQAQHAGDRRAS